VSKLTAQQRLFAQEYVVDLNGQQAAIRAGASPKSAKVTASRWLTKANVAKLVAELQEAKLARTGSKADRVLQRIEAAADVDPAAFFDPDQSVKSVHDMPLAARRALLGVDVEELFEGTGAKRRRVGVVTKLRWRDPLKADEVLAKHHGLLREILEVKDVTETRDISDEEWAKLAQLEHEVRGG
jgi:hypothetical protein